MRFSYTYRSSDGRRHEDRIEAATREEAFSLLRQRGIRAIKVVSLSGSKANGEEKIITRKRFVVAALIAGLTLGGIAAAWYAQADFRDGRIVALDRDSSSIVARHRAALATLHMGELRDYAAIAQEKTPGFLNQKIKLCYTDLNSARGEIRDLFREPFDAFAADKAAAAEVHRLYTVAMDALDLEESRFTKDVKAYRLLDANRERWSFAGGKLSFADPMLETDFSNLTREIIR